MKFLTIRMMLAAAALACSLQIAEAPALAQAASANDTPGDPCTVPVTTTGGKIVKATCTVTVNPATGGSNGSAIGTVGGTAPANASQEGLKTSSGSFVATCGDSTGVYCAPKVGASDAVETYTNVSANTSTTVCPTASFPVSVEIQVQGAGALGLKGQTLTSATYATGAGAGFPIMSAGALYTATTGITNAITFYGGAGVVICRQTLRQ